MHYTVNPSDCGWLKWFITSRCSDFQLPASTLWPATSEGPWWSARARSARSRLVCLLLTSARGTTGLPTAERPSDLPGCPHHAFVIQPDLWRACPPRVPLSPSDTCRGGQRSQQSAEPVSRTRGGRVALFWKDPPFWGGTFSAATSWTGWYLFLILYIYCLFHLLATVCVNLSGLLTIFIVFQLFFFFDKISHHLGSFWH